MGDARGAVPLQIQRVDVPHHGGSFGVRQQAAVVGGVFAVAVQRKGGNVIPLPPLMRQHRAHIVGQILKIPLVDKPVDLPGFFPGAVLGIHVVHHGNEADAPLGKFAVEVLFHQLHIAGKAGLRFG